MARQLPHTLWGVQGEQQEHHERVVLVSGLSLFTFYYFRSMSILSAHMYMYPRRLALGILSTYMFMYHMCLVHGEARESLDILLESEMLVRLHKGAGNRMWFLCKSGQCS